MKEITEYHITYYSPGTLFSENSTKTFDKFDLKLFCESAKIISERHGAKPFGFRWEQVSYLDFSAEKIKGYNISSELKIISKSPGMIYITGKLVFSENLDKKTENIWISNLECNCDGIGIINRNSYRYNGMFGAEDIIIDWSGNIIQRGDSPEIMIYREKIRAKKQEEYKKYQNR